MSEKRVHNEVINFLRSVSVMSISVNHHPKPINSIVLFAVDDDFTFYFAAHAHSHKAKALTVNPDISMSIWEHKAMLVQVCGLTELIEKQEEVDMALEKISESVNKIPDFWPPVLQLDPDNYSIFKVVPEWIRKLNLTDDSIRSSEDPFEQILP